MGVRARMPIAHTESVMVVRSVGGGAARLAVPSIMLAILAAWLSAGCAIHYFDAATGTEHIWGIGHLKMKAAAPEEGVRAVVRGTDVVGISFGRADQQLYVTVGWHRIQRLDVLAEDTALRLEWPGSDFSGVRVGSAFPWFPSGNAGAVLPVSGTVEMNSKVIGLPEQIR